MSTQAEIHNRLAPQIVRTIVAEPLAAGGEPTDCLIILETVIVGVCEAVVRLGGDEKVLDVVMDRARQRLAQIRLGGLQTDGTA